MEKAKCSYCHRLMLDDDSSSESAVIEARTHSMCADHDEAVILYCDTCGRLLCNGCLSDHDDHNMNNIRTAFKKIKIPIEDKADQCQSMSVDLNNMKAELTVIENTLDEKTETQKEELNASYSRRLKTLDDWYKVELDKIDTRHQKLKTEAASMLKVLNMRLEEIDQLLSLSTELLTGDEVMFLRSSSTFTTRIDNCINGTSAELQEQTKELKELESVLCHYGYALPPDVLSKSETKDVDPPTPKTELKINKPIMKFVTVNDDLSNFKKHSLSVEVDWNIGRYGVVLTDGILRTGLQYWEIEVIWGVPSSVCRLLTIGSLGIQVENTVTLISESLRVRARCDSWCVRVLYDSGTGQHTFECTTDLVTDHQTILQRTEIGSDYRGSARLGFLLNGSLNTLSVVSCNDSSLIYTFRDIDQSRSFVPMVDFSHTSEKCISVYFRMVQPNAFSGLQTASALLQSSRQ